MNRNVVIGFLVFALVIGLLFWLFDGTEGGRGQKPKQVYTNWTTEYQLNSTNPRDVGFFQSLLQTHIKDTIHVANSWSDIRKVKNYQKATYFFIGDHFGLENSKFSNLEAYADSGATLFLSFHFITSNLYKKYFYSGCYYWNYSNSLYAWVGDTTLRYPLLYENDTIHGDWLLYDPDAILDTNYQAYSFAIDKPIAFKETKGKGSIHFHCVPRLFENYQVIEPNGFAHASLILRQIPKDRPVIWLEVARLDPNADANSSVNKDNEKGKGKPQQDNSLIQFILKSDGLREAFILLIVLLLVYVLFRAKRREAILPGIAEKRNMSIAFVETLSSIYLSRKSNIGILQVLRKNFTMAVLRHFYIDLSKKDELEQNTKRLIEKSSYDAEKLKELIASLDPRKNTVDEKHLGQVYRNMRVFYLETGIAKARSQYVAAGKDIVLHKSVLVGSIGLLFGLMFLVRGLYLLVTGAGLGIVFVIISFAIIYLAARILAKPVGIISADKFTVFGFVFGKKEFNIDQGINTVVTPSNTTFYLEDGTSVTMYHFLLSRSGKNALAQFVEHLKQLNA